MTNESYGNKLKSKIFKGLGLLGILIIGLIAKFFGGYLYALYYDHNYENNFISGVYESVDTARNELPLDVDEYTTWEEINFDGSTVAYTYTVSLPGLDDSNKDAVLSEVRNNNTKPICENPEISKVLNNGIEYRYIYNDLNKNSIGSFVVTREICNNL